MRNATLGFFLVISAALNAQWSTDPANPLVICNASEVQSGVHAISDGGGGWFVFWNDGRLDPSHTKLYGQHLDANGNALWAPDGLLIVSHVDSTITHSAPVLLPDGSLLVGYIYQGAGGYNGRVNVMRIDPSGAPIWSDPVNLARSGPGTFGNIFGFDQVQALLSGSYAFFAWSFVPQGGNDVYAYERIDMNGTVQFGDIGNAVPNSGWGPFTIHDDLAGGLVFDWRMGNGAGAPLMAMRMDSTGTAAWASNLTVSLGSAGLNYTYSTADDGAGTLMSCWVTGQDLAMAKYDTSGTFEWSPQPFYACTESHGQDKPVIVLEDGFYHVAWCDNRPPALGQDLYMQKFDGSGAPQWAADGVPVIQLQTYVPTPGLVASDEGAVITTMDQTALGFCAMRILSDGAQDWAAPTNFCTPAFNPFYTDQVKLPDGQGGVVAFWSNQDNVYAARIYKNGDLGNHVGVPEHTASGLLQLFPSPTSGPLSVVLSDRSQLRSVRAIDVEGRGVAINATRASDRLNLDVAALANGIYTLELVTDADVSTGRFIIAR